MKKSSYRFFQDEDFSFTCRTFVAQKMRFSRKNNQLLQLWAHNVRFFRKTISYYSCGLRTCDFLCKFGDLCLPHNPGGLALQIALAQREANRQLAADSTGNV